MKLEISFKKTGKFTNMYKLKHMTQLPLRSQKKSRGKKQLENGNIVGPSHLWVLYSQMQPTMDQKNSEVPKSSKRQNVNLPHAGRFSYSIYIVFSYISNLEVI